LSGQAQGLGLFYSLAVRACYCCRSSCWSSHCCFESRHRLCYCTSARKLAFHPSPFDLSSWGLRVLLTCFLCMNL